MVNNSKKGYSSFLIVWSGQLISNIGSGLTAFSLGVFAFQLTHSATNYALIVLFSFLPSFLIRPLGGVLADRFDRRLLMIVGDLGSAAGLLFILTFFVLGKIEMWHIFAGVSLSSIFFGIQNPAYKASISDFLPEEAYSKASGLVQLAQSSQFLISPIVAGILLAVTTIQSIIIINILTYLFASLAVVVIKKRVENADKTPKENLGFFADLAAGFRVIVENKGILWLLLLVSLVNFFVGLLQSLFGPMVLGFANSQNLGFAQSTCAIGLLVSSLFIGVFAKGSNHVNVLTMALGLAGVAFALIGVTANLAVIIASGFVFFLCLPFVNTNIDVLIRKNVDLHSQGRVWAIVSMISYLGNIVAYASAGILADQVFAPLLQNGGWLTSTLGAWIGVGPGRGIGLMFLVSGLLVAVTAFLIGRISAIRNLEIPRAS